jgi:hypothetical protein
MGRPSSRDALAGAALVLALGTGCELVNQPTYDGLVVRTAEVVGDTVRIAFSVDVPQSRWSWYVDLDTDQALDAGGKKTGYGAFGIEYVIDSRDELGDSVAVRPTSGPADTSAGARGWPLPVGYAKREPSKWISLRFPASMLADDGVLAFRVTAWEGGDFGFIEDKVDSTHVRTPAPHARMRSRGARVPNLPRRRG